MNKYTNARRYLYEILEHGFDGSNLSKLMSGVIVFLIVSNVIAIILESYQPIGEKYQTEFYWFNLFSVAVFTIEYIARIWVCIEARNTESNSSIKTRIGYVLSPVSLIDLLAIAPFYLSFFISIDLRYLRMLRMLRLLKLTHYFKGLKLFTDVIKKELPSIGAAMIIMIVLVILSASIIYSVEHNSQPEAFDSIPSAIWWSVVTMTTVGYGDVIPVTFTGKFVSIFIMLLGVGIVALPAAMMAAKFGEELRARRRNLEKEIETALEDGIITPNERLAINTLSESLGISRADLEQLIADFKADSSKAIESNK